MSEVATLVHAIWQKTNHKFIGQLLLALAKVKVRVPDLELECDATSGRLFLIRGEDVLVLERIGRRWVAWDATTQVERALVAFLEDRGGR